jgi:hypothetical protein
VTGDSKDPDDARLWTEPDGVHLDVRSLECPEPMVEILKLLDGGDAGSVVIVHLDQEPVFLYPELDDRGWTHEVIASGCGEALCAHEVRLKLVRMLP